jgi:hypothetical protein
VGLSCRRAAGLFAFKPRRLTNDKDSASRSDPDASLNRTLYPAFQLASSRKGVSLQHVIACDEAEDMVGKGRRTGLGDVAYVGIGLRPCASVENRVPEQPYRKPFHCHISPHATPVSDSSNANAGIMHVSPFVVLCI